jgi:hypothetical protein
MKFLRSQNFCEVICEMKAEIDRMSGSHNGSGRSKVYLHGL